MAAAHRIQWPKVSKIDQCWSMDFFADNLFNGRRIRALTVVDNLSRECLAIHVGQGIKGKDVVQVMERLRLFVGRCPERIQVDNGSEFISKDMDKWAYEHDVILDFSRPGKPTDNALIESFNGSFRDECLNTNWFLSIDDARKKVDTWRRDYNGFRPHSSLGNLTPRNSSGNSISEARNLYNWSVQIMGEAQLGWIFSQQMVQFSGNPQTLIH